MAEWTLQDGGQATTIGAVTASTTGTAVTAPGTANTKGSWVQLTASAAHGADTLIMQVGFSGNGSSEYLIDIGVGAAGSEQVLVPNIMFAFDIVGSPLGVYQLPVRIAAGQRVAARLQCNVDSRETNMTLMLIKGGYTAPGFGRATAYGINTADSGATNIDAGASANTKGAWAQITASTTAPIRALLPMLGYANDFARTACTWLIDIGVGAAGSEQVIVPNIGAWYGTNTEGHPLIGYPPIPVSIAAGQRLAARCQCSITTAGDRTLDIGVLGFD